MAGHTSVDTLADLSAKLRAITRINNESLEFIEAFKNDNVIVGYTYSLNLSLSASSRVDRAPVLKVVARAQYERVSVRLEEWRYSGEALQRREDISLDGLVHIDACTLQTFADVVRLNSEFNEVASKFASSFVDVPENRQALRACLTNLERLHVAVGELHGLALDMNDALGSDVLFASGLQSIADGLGAIGSRLTTGSVSVCLDDSVGRVTRPPQPEIMSLRSPGQLACTTRLDYGGHIRKIAAFELCGVPFLAISGCANNMIKLWDADQEEFVGSLLGHTGQVGALAVFERGDLTCLASGSYDKTIKLWNLQKQELLETMTGHIAWVVALVVFERRGETCLASGSYDETIKLWDVNKERLLGTLKGHTGAVFSFAVFERRGSPFLASGASDKTIKLWDLESEQLVRTLGGHFGFVEALVSFEHRGVTCLASGSQDNAIKLWDLDQEEFLESLKGHTGPLCALAVFECRGVPCLASGSFDETIKLWDIEAKVCLSTLGGHVGSVFSLALFERRGVVCLASGSADRTIKLWSEQHIDPLPGNVLAGVAASDSLASSRPKRGAAFAANRDSGSMTEARQEPKRHRRDG